MMYILGPTGKLLQVDIPTWARWFETNHHARVVAADSVGDVRVSTVFLGIDHNFGGKGKPILWETMIFGGPNDNYQERHCSLEDALAGHARALAIARVGK